MLEVRLAALRVDLPTNTPVVLLQEVAGERSLPIYIGAPEATAIAYALERVAVPRPMTHDLMKELVDAFGATVERIVVTEIREGTFFAVVHLQAGERKVEISARPSDAIALAARTDSPIYVEDDLMEIAGVVIEEEPEVAVEENPEELVGQFRDFLNQIRPEDFSG
ncbi:MAG TPA: bifunctional nuclease family protein [Acidimicrobiales bacterium]|nr:bifunctional nuclease family protein [Acidimicrobiales bacterium]